MGETTNVGWNVRFIFKPTHNNLLLQKERNFKNRHRLLWVPRPTASYRHRVQGAMPYECGQFLADHVAGCIMVSGLFSWNHHHHHIEALRAPTVGHGSFSE